MRGIALIGPMACGKSSVGERLAEKCGLLHVELDDHRWRYYDGIGFDHERAKAWNDAGDTQAILEYSKPFEVHAVEQATTEFQGHVISFGAGHSVHDDTGHLERVRFALRGWAVVLLLPSADVSTSLEVLDERLGGIEGFPVELGHRLNEQYLRHPANQSLASAVVFTNDKTVVEVAHEVHDHAAR